MIIMRTYSITSKQCSSIHNAMCDINNLLHEFKMTFKEDSHFIKSLERAAYYLDPVRKDLMARVDADHDRIWNLQNQVRKQNQFKYTVWSIYDLESFDELSGIPEGTKLKSEYSDVVVTVDGTTWLDAWKAVEKIAAATQWNEDERNGFGDHVFIEKFVKQEDGSYLVWLGS